MKMHERVRSLSRGRARAVAAALLVGACGGTVGQAPILGSESHFLAYCDTACAAGLECIGGICTRSCLTESTSCSDLGGGAQCTNQSVEPGQVAVCDVSCTQGSDCAALGAGYRCEGGYCRSKASPVVSTSDETPENAGGSGGSAGGGSEGDSALCEAFRDQSPPPDIREISIVNTGGVPLYILPVVLDCESPSSLLEVQRDGQAVNVVGRGRCGNGCQEAIDQGWLEQSCPPVSPCAPPPPVLIEPGQTLTQPTGLEVIQQNLPRACAQGISTDTVACYSRVIPQPGNYTLTVRASLGLDCEAEPSATGCDNPYPIFTFPSPWYFENQELRIAAP